MKTSPKIVEMLEAEGRENAMSAFEDLNHLVGTWIGTNHLWLDPNGTARASDTSAAVSMGPRSGYIMIEYTWVFDGEPQDGVLLLGYDKEQHEVTGFWIDSWHMRDKFMICQGNRGGKSAISIKGSYAAPPGPDWSWRTVIESKDRDAFCITMYNITPEGKEALAVRAEYVRKSQTVR